MNKLLYLSLVLAALPVHAAQSPTDIEALDELFTTSYYQIEFFVFERPNVMEFNTVEVLARDGKRTFQPGMRTQRLAIDELWPYPVDARTRTCLTFPTLTYELEPDDEALADDTAGSPTGEPRPVPVIEPRLEPDPLLDLMAAVAEFERALEDRSQRWMDPDTFLLAADARRVERRLGRVLFHGKWIQNVPPREAPDPILIQAGAELTDPFPVRELTGTVGVTLGRFLHFRADLFLHAPGLGLRPVSAALTATGDVVVDEMGERKLRYMELSESRRMRSEEIHYLDHPKLGVVVRIDPVEYPQGLIDAFDALNEDPEDLGD